METVNSLGERLIRTDFAKDDSVSELKNDYAKLLDKVNAISAWYENTQEELDVNRWVSIAKTELETSAMYAVKALTAK